MCQLVLRVSCPNSERFIRNWQWEMCMMWWTTEWDTCLIEWDNMEHGSIRKPGGPGAWSPGEFWNLGPLDGWKCIRNFANHMFSESFMAWPSPNFQRFKSLDPTPLLQNVTDDPPLWSLSPPPPPPPPPINNVPSLSHLTIWLPHLLNQVVAQSSAPWISWAQAWLILNVVLYFNFRSCVTYCEYHSFFNVNCPRAVSPDSSLSTFRTSSLRTGGACQDSRTNNSW